MNKIITIRDYRNFDFRNLWELKNPKFSQAPEDNGEAVLQFKLRHNGSTLGHLTNYLTPYRLYGFRKLLAWTLWLFILILIGGTIIAYQTGTGEMGQIYFTLFFVVLYLLCFTTAGASRLRRWDRVYTKAIKADLNTHTKPAIIFDGQDMLLANERIFDLIGERPISAFVDNYHDQLKHNTQQALQAQKAEAKETARVKKEKDAENARAAKQLRKDRAALRALSGGQESVPSSKGSLASRAAKAARGTTEGDFLATRAAKAARGAPPRSSDQATPSGSTSVKIEGYTGSYWQACATGLQNNPNYIAKRMQHIRKSNPNFTKFRAIDSNGRIVDIG